MLIFLRAGYFWDPTPIPETTLDMTTADCDRHIFTCGLGLMGLFNGRVNLGSYFQVLDFVKRTIQPGESENLGGTKISLNNRRNDTELQIDGNVFHAGLSFTLFS